MVAERAPATLFSSGLKRCISPTESILSAKQRPGPLPLKVRAPAFIDYVTANSFATGILGVAMDQQGVRSKLLGMDESSLGVLRVFSEMGREMLDLHTLFEETIHDPASEFSTRSRGW